MSFDQDRFIQFKKAAKDKYFNLGKTYCPALKSHVNFNSDGYYHMIFKSSREKRNVSAQYNRLILIPLLIPVLKNAKRIHETRVEEIKVRGVTKIRTCYALIEFVGDELDAKVKVVVRKVGTGGYYFHSAMKMRENKTKTPPEEVS